jgi:hypothetical protein
LISKFFKESESTIYAQGSNDLSILRQHLEKMSTKFCYIGERHSGTVGDVKPKKMKLVDTNFCTLGRSAEWYKEKFAGWSGPELIFDYI